jgi:beta-N-acetylhexosaminidase
VSNHRRGRRIATSTSTALVLALATPLACGSQGGSGGSGTAAPALGKAAAASPAAPATTATRPTAKPTPACTPASAEKQAAATLVVGMPQVTDPNDPLAKSLPAMGVGGIFLSSANVQNGPQVTALIQALKQRRGAPMLIAVDEEGGRVTTFDAVLGWQQSARDSAPLGAAALRTRAADLARQMRALGVTVDFAPDADVTDGVWNGPIGDRSYSGDASVVSSDAIAVAQGLSEGGVTPVLKHYPGLGQADADTHVDAPVVTTPKWGLVYRDLAPFKAGIEAGAPVIMVGHASYPSLGTGDVPASLSPAIYQLLRQTGFRGVTITDSLGMGAVNLRYDFPVAAVTALKAGVDGLLATDGNQALRMRDAIVTAVHTGQLSHQRLADAAARMTALAGGDPYALTCTHVTLPHLR